MSANNYTDNPRSDNQLDHAAQKGVETNRKKLTSIIKTMIFYGRLKLVDVLSRLSFADDYPEIMRLHDSFLPTEDDSLRIVGDLIWSDLLRNMAGSAKYPLKPTERRMV